MLFLSLWPFVVSVTAVTLPRFWNIQESKLCLLLLLYRGNNNSTFPKEFLFLSQASKNSFRSAFKIVSFVSSLVYFLQNLKGQEPPVSMKIFTIHLYLSFKLVLRSPITLHTCTFPWRQTDAEEAQGNSGLAHQETGAVLLQTLPWLNFLKIPFHLLSFLTNHFNYRHLQMYQLW